MKNKAKEKLPLKNIKVLDASSFIAAPLASAIMSDYGAEVIKIESPSGDTYREAVIGGQVWPESNIDWEVPFQLKSAYHKKALFVIFTYISCMFRVFSLILFIDFFDFS